MSEISEIELKSCPENSPYWRDIERLFQSEWADFKLSDNYLKDGYAKQSSLPPVLIALNKGEVIGGLSYSLYLEPHKSSEVIWVNSVFVVQQWRGQGIASQLLERAVQQLSNNVQHRLYAYTNIPALYTSLGWFVVDIDSEPGHQVMSIAL
ncbi:hypothetical protein GCM10007916_31260 [Psychromonas marina]|uniref:N-acetyltransferase domain-containing protein n=1 Tax=Psychromonas marina TaxID=88364 RepID=A0ABQ6E4Y6_9GAMM|nr:GNAT family N-acetyltransferase [Psychromonas marina]GLS92056.1 hypothetical protein GCM10007916_31260 [Psychromonas marina]